MRVSLLVVVLCALALPSVIADAPPAVGSVLGQNGPDAVDGTDPAETLADSAMLGTQSKFKFEDAANPTNDNTGTKLRLGDQQRRHFMIQKYGDSSYTACLINSQSVYEPQVLLQTDGDVLVEGQSSAKAKFFEGPLLQANPTTRWCAKNALNRIRKLYWRDNQYSRCLMNIESFRFTFSNPVKHVNVGSHEKASGDGAESVETDEDEDGDEVLLSQLEDFADMLFDEVEASDNDNDAAVSYEKEDASDDSEESMLGTESTRRWNLFHRRNAALRRRQLAHDRRLRTRDRAHEKRLRAAVLRANSRLRVRRRKARADRSRRAARRQRRLARTRRRQHRRERTRVRRLNNQIRRMDRRWKRSRLREQRRLKNDRRVNDRLLRSQARRARAALRRQRRRTRLQAMRIRARTARMNAAERRRHAQNRARDAAADAADNRLAAGARAAAARDRRKRHRFNRWADDRKRERRVWDKTTRPAPVFHKQSFNRKSGEREGTEDAKELRKCVKDAKDRAEAAAHYRKLWAARRRRKAIRDAKAKSKVHKQRRELQMIKARTARMELDRMKAGLKKLSNDHLFKPKMPPAPKIPNKLEEWQKLSVHRDQVAKIASKAARPVLRNFMHWFSNHYHGSDAPKLPKIRALAGELPTTEQRAAMVDGDPTMPLEKNPAYPPWGPLPVLKDGDIYDPTTLTKGGRMERSMKEWAKTMPKPFRKRKRIG